jgi:hypothetical protein
LDAAFTYTLTGAAEGVGATVRIAPEAPLAVDLVPDHIDDVISRASRIQEIDAPGPTGTWTELYDRPMGYLYGIVNDYPIEIKPFNDWTQLLFHGGRGEIPSGFPTGLVGATEWTYAQLLEEAGVVGAPAPYSGNYAGRFASTTFSSPGGTICVDWAFSGPQLAAPQENDAVVWILRDDKNQIVDCGSAWQPNLASKDSAYWGWVEMITVPLSDMPKTYTLVIGVAEIGTATHGDTEFLVDVAVSYSGGCEFRGNVIAEAALDGPQNLLDAGSHVSSVEYHGAIYEMDARKGYLNIVTTTGTLRIQADGTYGFFAVRNTDGAAVAEDLAYTITDPDGEKTSALLSLRGNDYRLNGSNYDDVLDNSASNSPDLVQAGAGDDIVHGGMGNELLYGQDGNDTIHGNGGADRIYGGLGDDLLKGDVGNDILAGGGGNDRLLGGQGDDILYGGGGDNILRGDAGADVFAWKHAGQMGGSDRVEDFSFVEGDRLSFAELLDEGQSLAEFLEASASDLNLDAKTDEFSFTLTEGGSTVQATIQCDPLDAQYTALKNNYTAADSPAEQQEALSQLLQTMAGG